MQYTKKYISPLGEMLMTSSGTALTGLWFCNSRYYAEGTDAEKCERSLPVFDETKEWLDIYFSGKIPPRTPPLLPGGTDFRLRVWELLKDIPYGETVTYGEIADRLAKNGKRMSAQAVGGAVGHNPISIIIPCHRVIGADGRLVGYGGGLDRKAALLRLEGISAAF